MTFLDPSEVVGQTTSLNSGHTSASREKQPRPGAETSRYQKLVGTVRE